MDLSGFKFDFSGLNTEDTKKEEPVVEEVKAEEPKKDFDFESLTKKFDKEEETKAEEPADEPKEKVKEPVKETPVETKDETPEVKEESETPADEKEPSEEVKEEAKTEPEPKQEETDTKEEEKEEEPKPKKKRHRRTKKELEAAKEADAEKDVKEIVAKSKPAEEPAKVVYMEPHENKVDDYNECMNQLFYNHEDKRWDEIEEMISNELEKIKITDDINPATLSAMAANVDEAFDMVSQLYYKYKSAMEQLMDKETGKVAYIRGINSIGTNPDERKRNAWIACATYKEAGKNCNLLELVSITRERYNFLSGAFERVKSKQHILFTLTANLKMAK